MTFYGSCFGLPSCAQEGNLASYWVLRSSFSVALYQMQMARVAHAAEAKGSL